METNKICPNCRKTLPPDVPLGLCPECLIKSGFPTGTDPSAAAEGPGSRFVPPPVEEIARLFPQFEILGLIGRGGMGAVYKARQPALDRLVALKVLPPAVAGDPGFAERFNREARALARLNHPNIVAVHDFGQAGPLHYLLMEFVDGTNLREVERAGKLSPEQALAIVPQICEALQFAHNEGVVHRDIKPENLLLDKRGRLKITDFGIAKIVGAPVGKVSLTGARDVVGTPHYMAPEQIEQPQRVDHRADIYSLGVVFYEMLTGELPLGKFQPPSKKVQIDVRLDEVVLHTLEKEPERRYQQASEVRTAVETIAAGGASAGVIPRRDQTPVTVRRQVLGPAIGLLVTGILNWLLIPTAIWLFAWGFPHTGIYSWTAVPGSALVGVALLSLGLCSFIIFAAFKMMQLERRGAAMLASVLTILVSPGNLIGLPIGIWALVVLSRREVRDAFAANQRPRSAPAAGGLGWKIAGVAAVLIGLIVVFSILMVNRPQPTGSDYIGQAWFPRGDSIEITSVDRSTNRIVVKGHYNLVSADKAGLALHLCQTNGAAIPDDATQAMLISRGRGDFELVDPNSFTGFPYVVMSSITSGWPMAQLYFGTRAEALAESKLKLHDYLGDDVVHGRTAALAPQFGPATETILTSSQNRVDRLLDLDTGRFVTSTNFGANDRETHAWVRANGLDALGVVEKGMPAVLCFDMAVVPAPSNSWEAVTARNVVTNWGLGQQEPNKITPLSTVTDRTDTWWFRTREGGQGSLQILGPNLEPPGVKIRYKLVQHFPATGGRIAPAVVDQIQAAFAELKGLNDMTSGRQYELPVGGKKAMGEGDDFLRRRTGAEILDSGLSSGCGDYAVAFIALMERRGLQTLLVDSAEVSLYSLEHHFSGHAVVAVRDPVNARWLLADPTNRRMITNNWSISDKTFYDGRYWIGYCGPLDQYPAHTPEGLKAFYAETLKRVPPDVWHQRIFKLNFKVDASLIDAGGSYLNPNIPQLTASQDAALVKFGIHPEKEVRILLTKGSDDARSTLEYSDQAGWVCTLGLRSSCDLGLVNYLQLQVASEAVHNPQAISSRQTATIQSVAAARAWLASIDDHQYAESWKSGADYFRGAVTQDKWVSGLVSFREPLGKLVSRSLKSAEPATSLPGAPDGQYVVMQFNTSFANKKSAVETVTFMLEKDGHWRAAGYFIN